MGPEFRALARGPGQLSMTSVLFDVGGTWIRGAVLGPNGPTTPVRRATPKTGAGLVDELVRMTGALVANASAKAAGVLVAIPGEIEPDTGAVVFAGNLNASGLPLRAELERALGVPGVVVNDTNAQALAVPTHGLGSLLYIAAGSGVGGALVEDGRLVVGGGFAGEIGHVQVAPSATITTPRCYCGRTRCLELFASGTALERQLGPAWWERGDDDVAVQAALNTSARLLADAIDTARVLFDPRTIHVASFLCRYEVVVGTLTQLISQHRVPHHEVILTTSDDPTELTFRGLARLAGR